MNTNLECQFRSVQMGAKHLGRTDYKFAFSIWKAMMRDMLSVKKRQNSSSKSHVLESPFGELHGGSWPTLSLPYFPVFQEGTQRSPRTTNAFVLSSQNTFTTSLMFFFHLFCRLHPKSKELNFPIKGIYYSSGRSKRSISCGSFSNRKY